MSSFEYQEKFKKFEKALFWSLPKEEQNFLEKLAFQYRFTYQEFHQCCNISRELQQWGEGSMAAIFNGAPLNKPELFKIIRHHYQSLKENKSYNAFTGRGLAASPIKTLVLNRPEAKILGTCPVASEKTLCCNLQTLDAVRNCGLDCSYCSIQSFNDDNSIIMDADFGKKLMNLPLDKNQVYHIGTGQSSDSLMWGNKEGLLEDLLIFARKNPNVILEFKTKSANIDYLLKADIPKNVITTWSLNPDIIIINEEHRTAPLRKRLEAARKMADKNRLVGFHFHPMIYYTDYQKDYGEVVDIVVNHFSPREVALISMGTVTFTKKVMKEIRSREIKSKILQMPFHEVAGKFSYPDELKKEMFKALYHSFSSWHHSTFFYLCMEPASLWEDVFGFKYQNNAEFESQMKKSYQDKIKGLP